MNNYLKFIGKRIITMILLFLFISLFIFFILRLVGVKPISVLGGEKVTSAVARLELEKQFDLNKPLIVQYGDWMKGVFNGNLGVDYVNKQSVSGLIIPRIPITVGLVLLSILFAAAVAIPAGSISAMLKNTPFDTTVSIVSLLLASMPGFLVSILMIVFCSRFFPNYSFIGTYDNFSEYLSRIALPSLALSFSPIAYMTRVLRSSMVEQLKAGYVQTAKAKGLGTGTVLFKHAFHNSVLPMLTVGTMMVGTTVAGAVLVETIFSLPGIGSLLIIAIKQNNYPISQTLLLVLLGIFLIISCVVDILYAVIDPRISLE